MENKAIFTNQEPLSPLPIFGNASQNVFVIGYFFFYSYYIFQKEFKSYQTDWL